MGGAGSAVLEALQVLEQPKPVLVLGVPDVFTEHGDPVKLLAELGLDAAGIQAAIAKRFVNLLN
jgi:1-deoxy-D-xylulose-5-phosphate synthase